MSAPTPPEPDEPKRPRRLRILIRPSDYASTAEATKAAYDALLETYPAIRPDPDLEPGPVDPDQSKEEPDARPDVR